MVHGSAGVLRLIAGVGLLVLTPAIAAGQTVVGQVRAAENGEGLHGAFVTLLDEAERGPMRDCELWNCVPISARASRVRGINAAEMHLPTDEQPILAEDVPRLDELFLTGTTTDVLPVVRLDGVLVGDGRPGPLTRAFADALARRIAATGDRVQAGAPAGRGRVAGWLP